MRYLKFLSLLISSLTFAQVGIGTVTPTGILEVSSALPLPSTQRAGFVPPTVALSARNSTATTTNGVNIINPNNNGIPQTGTIVYNTNTSTPGVNQVIPGYYYYNGSSWDRMATSGQSSTTYFTNAGVTIAPATVLTWLPGFPVSIIVEADTIIYLSGDVGVQTTDASNSGFSRVDVALSVTNAVLTNGGIQRIMPANNGSSGTAINYASFSQTLLLAAGTYNMGLAAAGTNSGSNATVGGDTNSVLQGELTVTILKK